jgi:hypothetical protein
MPRTYASGWDFIVLYEVLLFDMRFALVVEDLFDQLHLFEGCVVALIEIVVFVHNAVSNLAAELLQHVQFDILEELFLEKIFISCFELD